MSYQVYKVGGAVRDELLGKEVKDIDWVVVGATPETLLAQGYLQVGKDFPVFLNPETKEEYALARTERKSGHGYTGFAISATADVTLEEDLLRRDLTINAMAKDGEGNIIDPYHGQQDLKDKLLRHVSAAFEEDPLRVLRLARFYARFYSDGFLIADETKAMVQRMVKSGELSHLVPERIWLETQKALSEENAPQYFIILKELGVLSIVFPMISECFERNDANICNRLSYIALASQKNASMHIRVVLLLSIFDNIEEVRVFAKQYRLSSHEKTMAEKLMQWRSYFDHLTDARAWLQLLVGLDAFRKRDQLIDFLCCMGIIKVVDQELDSYYRNATLLLNIHAQLSKIDIPSLIVGVPSNEIPQKIELARLAIIDKMIKDCSSV